MEKRKLLSLTAFLAAILMLNSAAAVMPVYAEEAVVATATTQEEYTGTWKNSDGSLIAWTYDPTTETVTFSGNGFIKLNYDYEAWNYGWIDAAPRDENKNSKIKNVVFEEGITYVDYISINFFGYQINSVDWNDYSITFPESMTEFPPSDSNAKIIKGLYGSQAYYKFAGIKDQTFIGTGVAKNPLYPTSGKSGSFHGKWSYDYKSGLMSINGPGFISCSEASQNPMPIKGYIIDSDIVFPVDEKHTTSRGFNEYVYDYLFTGRRIYCSKDSQFAQEYEKICNIIKSMPESDEDYDYYQETMSDYFHVTYLDDDTPLCGDVNLDGRVDITDAVLLSKAVSGSVEVNDVQKSAMDCDGDGEISSNDATTLMQFLVHAVDSLPVK